MQKPHGKTIKIFLIDGDPNGRLTCELSNRTLKAYKIPRIKVKDCNDRDDLSNTGVYFLFGKDAENNDVAYIGEAETILKRLNQHKEKEFWNETIAFISKDENLNKAHAKYLENRLHEIAGKTGRYKLENSITPTQSSLSESERAEMEELIDDIKLLVNTLGHKLLEEKRLVQQKEKTKTFRIKATRGADAEGQPVSDGFVVFKDSKAAGQEVESMPPGLHQQREKLIDQGILQESGDSYVFTEDTIFSSPSTAASIVMGRNANGLKEWRTTDGQKLKDYESEENH